MQGSPFMNLTRPNTLHIYSGGTLDKHLPNKFGPLVVEPRVWDWGHNGI